MSKSLLRRAALALGAATLVMGVGTSQVASAAASAPAGTATPATPATPATQATQATPVALAAPTPIDGWEVQATTHVGGLVNTDVVIPQGSFTGTADFTAKTLGGNLTLPPATFTFNLFGLLPLSVEFNVDATASTTGTVDLAAGTVTARHTFEIRLSQLNLFGFLPLLDANTVCKTVRPITADLTGTVSGDLHVHLSGNYAIPAFQGCGLFNDLVSLSTSSPTNALDVTIAPPAA